MDPKTFQEPLVSLTLPLAPDAKLDLLKICLDSISTQTYRNFEFLILVSEGSPPELLQMVRTFSTARIFEGSLGKSAARNFLASEAKGEYMLYIDADMELSAGLIEGCVSAALEQSSQAVINRFRVPASEPFWGRCRSLERQLISEDVVNGIPLFLQMRTFREVNGFDESLDPLDDWGLTLKLTSKGVPFDRVESVIFIRETSDLVEIVRRKYDRGRLIPALVQKFPDAPHARFAGRFFNAYLRNWKVLLGSPILAVGLLFLKALDMMALSWGRLHPPQEVSEDGVWPYLQPDVAQTFDEIRLGDNFNRFKHYAEIQSLVELLGQPSGVLLEVGCGTGRVTQELIKKGFRILPSEISPAMLGQYVRKPFLPEPLRADGTTLPFRNDCFEGAYSLRVVWHLSSSRLLEQMLSEMARVSNRMVIFDIANEQRWGHPLIRNVARVFYAFRPLDRRSHKSSLFITLHDFTELAQEFGLRVERSVPLDVLSPIWLNLLPSRIARAIFPTLRRLEMALFNAIPPGRFLVSLTVTNEHDIIS